MLFAPLWTQCRSKRLRFGSALILVGAFSCLHLGAIGALFSSLKIVNSGQDDDEPLKPVLLYHSAKDIVHETYRATFAHLEKCPGNYNMRGCAQYTYNKRKEVDFPWWFQSMLRDAAFDHNVHANWHDQSAPNALDDDRGIRMCAMEKIGIKQWKRVFCQLQNNETFVRGNCFPKSKVPDSVPKFVFLRDPLERFLSAFIDKCLRSTRENRESHCAPAIVFEKDENGLTKGLLDSDKTFFEAYVNTMPLQWNMHFFPQSLYCDGLYRHIPTYDFVGMMDENFYDDLNRLGLRYGKRMAKILDNVFHFQRARNASKHNQGVETSASSHVLEFYTPKTVRQVLEYVAIDYYLLNIPIPTWAERMLEQDAEGSERSLDETYSF